MIFAGTPEFAAVILRALLEAEFKIEAVLTQPDRPKGRGRALAASPVKTVALEYGLPLLQPLSLKDPGALALLQSYTFDYLVVAAYGLIIPQAILDLPQQGPINVHGSLLPRWRGAAPIQRAILAGDEETGITLMQMEAGLDTGPMLKKSTIRICDEDTFGTLHDALATLGASLLIEYVKGTPQLIGEPQDAALATYAHKIEKSEMALDCNQPAISLWRKVRAFSPYPGAYIPYETGHLKCFDACYRATTTSALPGTIVALDPTTVWIATGEGELGIKTLQFPSRTVQTVAHLQKTGTLPWVAGKRL